MITRHIKTRPPKKTCVVTENGIFFSWSRKAEMNGALLTYSLFRRDLRNAIHQKQLQYLPNIAQREMIAADLWRARKQLSDRVLEMDLIFLEQQEQAA